MLTIRHDYSEVYEHKQTTNLTNHGLCELLMRLLDANIITEKGSDYIWALHSQEGR